MTQEVVTQAAVVAPSHSHQVVFLWVLGTLVIAEGIAIALMFYARGGWSHLDEIPVTQLRSLTAIILFGATVMGTGIIGYAAGVWPPEYVLDAILIAETTWAGIEVGAVWLKRRQNIQNEVARSPNATATATYPVPNPPQPPPVEPEPNALISPRPDLGVPDKGVL